MSEADHRRERPLLAGNVEALASAAVDGEPFARLELAHATASALVDAGRGDGGPATDRLVELAETVGLDTLSELWRDDPELWARLSPRGSACRRGLPRRP